MIAIDYSQLLQLVLPEVIVVVAALACLAADLLFMRGATHARPVHSSAP